MKLYWKIVDGEFPSEGVYKDELVVTVLGPSTGVISGGHCFLQAELETNQIQRVFSREFLRLLGLNGVSGNPSSILHPDYSNDLPSALDIAYFRLLYSSHIPPGMSLNAFDDFAATFDGFVEPDY